MQSRLNAPRALVFGGTGAVGSAVLRALGQAGVDTAFTWNRSAEHARVLGTELSMRAIQVDLADATRTRAALRDLAAVGFFPSVFIHCAGVNTATALADITDEDWGLMQAVNCHSALVAIQELAPRMAQEKEGHIVLVGALDRSQSAPMPVHFAASQGALSAMAMAVAKELGPSGVRINVVSLGLLDSGLGRAVSPKLVAEYKSFSALRRLGRPDEVAKAIVWLATENTYMNGRVLSVNGGL